MAMYLSENHRMNVVKSPKADSSDEEFTIPKKFMIRPNSPAKSGVHLIGDENDDDDERLARRKSRLLEPHPASANSPASASVTARRVDAAAPRGITQAQIGEHYGNCIRLAAENKITPKNAFNLHLIDYMSEMIKQEDFASFQIASSSLDAGAKIYAGRVDAVHQETYQVLTGLGRSGKPPVTDDQEPDTETGLREIDEDGLPVQSKTESRKKTATHREIIQKQLSKIRSKALAAKADVDPLFQHQTAAYDEGGTVELRLNQLSTSNSTCELILDSSTPVMQVFTQCIPSSQTNYVNMSGLIDLFTPILTRPVNQLTICSSLQNFHFSEWNIHDSSSSLAWDANTVDCPPLSSPVSLLNDSKLHLPENDADVSDNDDFNLEALPESGDQVEVCGSSAVAADRTTTDKSINGLEMLPVNASHIETTTTESELFVSSLKSMLDKQYEHFGQLNDHLLGMWAGPEHWRKKAKRRKVDGIAKSQSDCNPDADFEVDDEVVANGVTAVASRKLSRSKRDKVTKLSYVESVKLGENLTRSGRLSRREWPKNLLSAGVVNSAAANATVFKESYRQKLNRQMNMLPSEWSDSRQSLYQLMNREVTLRSTYHPDAKTTPNLNGTSNEPYNYMNGNSEFCAVVDCIEKPHTHDSFGDVDGGLDVQMENQVVDDDDDDDVIIPFDYAFTQLTTGNDVGGAGDLELITQPHKVARIEIGYARTAKMINVRRLKTAMWSFLEHSVPNVDKVNPSESPCSLASTASAPDAVSLDNSGSGDAVPNQDILASPTNEISELDKKKSPESKVPGARSFSELIDNLSNRISWQMAKELSISIALNCLLHLSNEKGLFLENANSFSDIYISQGLPSFELDHLKSFVPEDAGKPTNSSKRPKNPVYRPSTLDSWLKDDDRRASNNLMVKTCKNQGKVSIGNQICSSESQSTLNSYCPNNGLSNREESLDPVRRVRTDACRRALRARRCTYQLKAIRLSADKSNVKFHLPSQPSPHPNIIELDWNKDIDPSPLSPSRCFKSDLYKTYLDLPIEVRYPFNYIGNLFEDADPNKSFFEE